MTRQEHLQFCKICTNQKFDAKQGIVCRLTDAIANFENTCTTFEEDPILAEKEKQLETTRTVAGKEASQGKRFTNYILDSICILVFGFMFGVVVAFIFPSMLSILETDSRIIDYGLGFILGMIYYSFFEITTGRTIGKLITGTKVVDEYGNNPDIQTILVRSLCRYIPFNAFSFLGDGSGWHDTLSKTKVIEV
ncbi:putative RDD family membrane protein YckC [Aquimarina sp. EL_43]|uniref:RDD family protein n=1 Tax=unclassified Aquimarina TaxID=2627091 RepID=UPI0018C9E980|nr:MULTISPECIES: RDD family protein [unclassified Aquimarina]MBG6130739.1 putative RDD family membrane protein YckC [Aquimarina sp. EL_35]MBG6151114.1 putative RDD family membrane protein YckC [Aquimarina sp. EL_32]MBG6169129.1 putative RDD family membrane protein YckC [Aquimarina sp. EL_43]